MSNEGVLQREGEIKVPSHERKTRQSVTTIPNLKKNDHRKSFQQKGMVRRILGTSRNIRHPRSHPKPSRHLFHAGMFTDGGQRSEAGQHQLTFKVVILQLCWKQMGRGLRGPALKQVSYEAGAVIQVLNR